MTVSVPIIASVLVSTANIAATAAAASVDTDIVIT